MKHVFLYFAPGGGQHPGSRDMFHSHCSTELGGPPLGSGPERGGLGTRFQWTFEHCQQWCLALLRSWAPDVPRSGKRILTRRDQTASPVHTKISMYSTFSHGTLYHSIMTLIFGNNLNGLHRSFPLKAARVQWQAPSQWKDTTTGTKRKKHSRQHLLSALSRRNLLIIQNSSTRLGWHWLHRNE